MLLYLTMMFLLSLLLLSTDQFASAQISLLGPPTNLTAGVVSSSQINLSWNAPSDTGGSVITGYKIERSTDGGATWGTIVSNTGTTATTYSNTGLSPSTTYTYRVFAIPLVLTSSPSNTATATTSAPAATPPGSPTGLVATALSSSQIDLSWTAPSSNGGSVITGYKIERSTDGGTTWGTIVSNSGTTATTYSNTGLSPSTTYTYRVSAITLVLTISPSNTASATTSAPAAAPPPAPTGLGATTVSSSQINLSWTAPANNGGSAITGYKIYRSSSSGTEGYLTTLGNVTSYNNTGLASGHTYFYKITAVNSIGTSHQSNEASATTLAIPS